MLRSVEGRLFVCSTRVVRFSECPGFTVVTLNLVTAMEKIDAVAVLHIHRGVTKTLAGNSSYM